MSIESQRIGMELDRQAARDREWLEPSPERLQGFPPEENYYNGPAIIELCEAEQDHLRYSSVGQSLKEAIQSLETTLVTYEADFPFHNQRSPERQARYDYIRKMFAGPLRELKAARKLNDELGDFTGQKLTAAHAKVNPEIQRQAAEQSEHAITATKFATNFLNWVSQFERTEA